MPVELLTYGRDTLKNQAFSQLSLPVTAQLLLQNGGERKLCAAAQGTIRKTG